jgi:hypothetical protein
LGTGRALCKKYVARPLRVSQELRIIVTHRTTCQRASSVEKTVSHRTSNLFCLWLSASLPGLSTTYSSTKWPC